MRGQYAMVCAAEASALVLVAGCAQAGGGPDSSFPASRARSACFNQTALTWNNTMAAVVLSVIPVVLAFLLAQGQFIAGISAGAVKE